MWKDVGVVGALSVLIVRPECGECQYLPIILWATLRWRVGGYGKGMLTERDVDLEMQMMMKMQIKMQMEREKDGDGEREKL